MDDSTKRDAPKAWDELIDGRTVLTWVRCGGNRLLAVVADEPPKIIALILRTPAPDIRIINGEAIDCHPGPAWLARRPEVSWHVRCRTHGEHIILSALVVNAFINGRRAVAVATVQKPA